ncbi:DNA/RNA polymerases superfamily protein [Gossypium australe]|uniref:DNA/RNA polymerases superfamily protein n=1 Tax=Gossypium australe TaxID=47621 RepID=A0A5B6UX19_9ROSI|nr:DNA/RNA polymerases superfamily protein [Gossypium australe]
MSPFEALYGRRCRTPTCWMELSERKLVAQTTQDRQKTYAYLKRKEIFLEVGDKVFLNVSPCKKIIRFGQKGKLSSRFVGTYEDLERVGPLSYKLALPPELSKILNVFHVSMLRMYRSNPNHIVRIKEAKVEPNLSYEEELVYILAREVKELRNKRISLVKILWRNHSTKEATWERESQMRNQYPQLFLAQDNLEGSRDKGKGPAI